MTSYGYDISQIERTRLSRGLTKDALAKLAKVHPSTISNVLAGTSGTPTTIGKLAVALGLDLAELTVPLGEPVDALDGPDLQTRDGGPSTACGFARRGRASSEELR